MQVQHRVDREKSTGTVENLISGHHLPSTVNYIRQSVLGLAPCCCILVRVDPDSTWPTSNRAIDNARTEDIKHTIHR
jgi:hypothetical protein